MSLFTRRTKSAPPEPAVAPLVPVPKVDRDPFDYRDLWIVPKLPLDPIDVRFTVLGGPKYRGMRPEGTFSFSLRGRVVRPIEWEGFSCVVDVNESGGHAGTELEPNAYLGHGYCEPPGYVSIGLTVLPHVAQDMLIQLRRIARTQGEPRQVRIDMERFNVWGRTTLHPGNVGFAVPRLYF